MVPTWGLDTQAQTEMCTVPQSSSSINQPSSRRTHLHVSEGKRQKIENQCRLAKLLCFAPASSI